MAGVDEYDKSQYELMETRKESERVTIEVVRHYLDTLLYIRKTYRDTSLLPVLKKIQALAHPGIVRIETIAGDNGSLIVIERYLPGRTLDHCRPNDDIEATGWALQLCGILSHLHEQGVLHRDLKPSNIMLNDGRLTLFDFDISRTIKPDKEKDTVHIGTRGYASPEQFGFAQTDERSDIYSLGVIISEWSNDPGSSLARIANKCTAIDPKDRYQTVEALASALRSGEKRIVNRIKWVAISAAVVLATIIIVPIAASMLPRNAHPLQDAAVAMSASPSPTPSPTPSLSPSLSPSPSPSPALQASLTTDTPSPRTVTVSSESMLKEALETGTVFEIQLSGVFYITGSFEVSRMSLLNGSNITIEEGVEVIADTVDISGIGSTFTVNGALKGDTLYLTGGNSRLNLNGVIYSAPDPGDFRWSEHSRVSRVFKWTGEGWGAPRLIDLGTGSDKVYADTHTPDDIPYLLEKYPELKCFNIRGAVPNLGHPGFSINEDYTFTLHMEFNINGNRAPDPVTGDQRFKPVVIASGVVLTIDPGVELVMVSDPEHSNAIVGADGASRIAVEPGAIVWSYFVDTDTFYYWDEGIYTWNPTAEEWEKQR